MRSTWAIALAVTVACGFRPSNRPGEAGVGSDGPSASRDAPSTPDALHDAMPTGDAAPAMGCVASVCSAAGGTCQGTDCVIHVSDTSPVTCPPAMSCIVECDSGTACKNGIDCGQASRCVINCNTMNACQGSMIDCTHAGCTFYCRANNTCINSVFQCGPLGCDLECCTGNACGPNTSSGTMTTNSPGTCP